MNQIGCMVQVVSDTSSKSNMLSSTCGPFLYLCGHILVSEIREHGRVQVTSKFRLMRLITKHFHG